MNRRNAYIQMKKYSGVSMEAVQLSLVYTWSLLTSTNSNAVRQAAAQLLLVSTYSALRCIVDQ